MSFELTVFVQLVLAGFLCGLIGFERRAEHKEAGVRTHALVGIGAALFTVISLHAFDGIDTAGAVDFSRIMSQVVTGIGFLGAGMIIFRDDRVSGLTTAAGLWGAAAIGMAVGVGWYWVAVLATIIVVIMLYVFGKIFPRVSGVTSKKK